MTDRDARLLDQGKRLGDNTQSTSTLPSLPRLLVPLQKKMWVAPAMRSVTAPVPVPPYKGKHGHEYDPPSTALQVPSR